MVVDNVSEMQNFIQVILYRIASFRLKKAGRPRRPACTKPIINYIWILTIFFRKQLFQKGF